MCGRYVHKLTGEVQFSFFELSEIRLPVQVPRFNVAPTTEIPVVRLGSDGRVLVGMKWGLRPVWAKPDAKLPAMINARAETIAEKPAYRSAFKTRRCLVPASGYYEWKRLGVGPKQPFYFERQDGLPIAFGGIFEEGSEDQPPTVALITTRPNAEAAMIHDRMPVIVPRAGWKRWFEPVALEPKERERFLGPAPDGLLVTRPVSTRVNSVRNDDPALIEGPEVGGEEEFRLR